MIPKPKPETMEIINICGTLTSYPIIYTIGQDVFISDDGSIRLCEFFQPNLSFA